MQTAEIHTRLMKKYSNLIHKMTTPLCVCILGVGLSFIASACDSSDCPLNNTVMQKCGFYNTDGTIMTVNDTLTVTVRDSVILNRLTGGSNIMLPMSYNEPADTLVFLFKPVDAVAAVADTVVVSKTNTPHFVSLDCARSMFHTITGVSCSKRTPDAVYNYAIGKVVVTNAEVNYDEQENLQIFFNVYR